MMKAILLRDLRAYLNFWIMMLIIMILYTLLNLWFGSVDGIVGFLVVFLPSISVMILFAGDSEMMLHTAAMPVTRSDIVKGKYLSTYVIGISMLLITTLLMGILSRWYINAGVDFLMLLSIRGLVFMLLPMTLIMSVSYPFLFRFGVRFASMVIGVVIMMTYAVLTVLAERLFIESLNLDRRGIFVVTMGLLRAAEERFGVYLFYGITFLLMFILLKGSLMLALYWVSRKDLKE